ncbi:UNVERIFIED_CONTAM: hypothetical protein NCL1_43674 [Trichonephila clavipes]
MTEIKGFSSNNNGIGILIPIDIPKIPIGMDLWEVVKAMDIPAWAMFYKDFNNSDRFNPIILSLLERNTVGYPLPSGHGKRNSPPLFGLDMLFPQVFKPRNIFPSSDGRIMEEKDVYNYPKGYPDTMKLIYDKN